MKKSLIALAIAGTFAAPVFAASANVDFYGKFRVSLDHLNHGVGFQMNDETSRIGFKGAEDLGGGMKAIYQYETGFDAGVSTPVIGSTGYSGAASAAGGLGAQRDTFVGLAGDFGTVLVGRHDTPYKMVGSADLFGDTLADAQNGGPLCIICEDLRVTNAVAYVSPSFSGLTLVGAIVPGTGKASTAGTQSLNSISDAYSLAAMYNNGPLKLGAGYENLDHMVGNAAGASKQNAWKLNAGYTFGDLLVGATAEQIKNIGGVNGAKSTDYLLSAAYGMGPITLAAQFGKRNQNDTAGNNDLTDTTVGVVYSLSKRTSTYVGYAHYSGNGANAIGYSLDKNSSSVNALTIGLNHDF